MAQGTSSWAKIEGACRPYAVLEGTRELVVLFVKYAHVVDVEIKNVGSPIGEQACKKALRKAGEACQSHTGGKARESLEGR